MTYREFINDIRDQANYLERSVIDSQLVRLDDEMGEDDTIVMAYIDEVEQFMDNVTGVHGHTLEVMK